MSKKILSVILAVFMLVSAMALAGTAAYADETADGEYFTYYFYAPANFFTTNESIGLYYWTPAENAKWPGVEITADNCVFKAEDGSRVYKVQVWQSAEDTAKEMITTPTIIFNSFVDASIDEANGHQTANINVEGYLPEDIAELKYGEGFPHYDANFSTDNFNNMIYVPDPSQVTENDFSGATQIGGGVWYYYWGDGKYGTTPTDPSAAKEPTDTASKADEDVASNPSVIAENTTATTGTTAPRTGDTASVALIVVAIAAAASIALTLRKRVTE